MDSEIREKIESVKNILTSEMNYIEALEKNDADVSLKTLDIFADDMANIFDKFQINFINDTLKKTEGIQTNEEKTPCKFVSLF